MRLRLPPRLGALPPNPLEAVIYFGVKMEYDKKMLWRANLYIDEGEGIDWNDFHKWNAPPPGQNQVRDRNGVLKPVAEVSPWWSPEWGYNEWNWNYDRAENYKQFLATSGAENQRYIEQFNPPNPGNGAGNQVTIGDGGQTVVIPKSTWSGTSNDINTSTNFLIQNSVIYCFAETTSPFQFGEDMESLRREIRDYWNNLHLQQPNNINYQLMFTEWDSIEKTTAPSRNKNLQVVQNQAWVWENYKEFSRVPGARRSSNDHLKFRGLEDGYPYEDAETGEFKLNGVGEDLNAGNHGKNVTGVDCGGLVYMSASYSGSPYTKHRLSEGHRPAYLDIAGVDDGLGDAERNNLWGISRKVDIEGIEDPLLNSQLIVPGDIFYYAGYHIGMIGEIIPGDNMSSLTGDHFPLLESVYRSVNNGSQGRVMKEFDVNYMTAANNKNWNIGRMMVE